MRTSLKTWDNLGTRCGQPGRTHPKSFTLDLRSPQLSRSKASAVPLSFRFGLQQLPRLVAGGAFELLREGRNRRDKFVDLLRGGADKA